MKTSLLRSLPFCAPLLLSDKTISGGGVSPSDWIGENW